MAPVDGVWHVRPTFWLPGDGLREKARPDRVPYDVWARAGLAGRRRRARRVDYEFVAAFLWDFCQANDVRRIAFDRWGLRHLKPLLPRPAFARSSSRATRAIFEPFGQGFQSMTPALRRSRRCCSTAGCGTAGIRC